MDYKEECAKKNYVFKGKIINVRCDDVRLPNGKLCTRELVEHPGGVCVLAVTEKDEVILVEQFRYPYKKPILEIPAGKLEAGENVELCGRRELTEETGATAKEFTFMTEIYPTVGYTNEVIHLFLAKGLTFANTHFDEDEFLEIKKIPLNDAMQMVKDGQIKDSKTMIALMLYKLKH